MKMKSTPRVSAVMLACWVVCAPQLVQADHPARPANSALAAKTAATVARDVALHEGGVLQGQLLDAQGRPQGHQRVAIVHQGELVARVQTDAEGRFAAERLTGGVYIIQTEQAGGVYRLWAPRTAPPSAHMQALLVADSPVVRGQNGQGNQVLQALTNPWVLGGVTAAAIAVPLALDGDDAS